MHTIDDALLAFRVHIASCHYTVPCDVACAHSSHFLDFSCNKNLYFEKTFESLVENYADQLYQIEK